MALSNDVGVEPGPMGYQGPDQYLVRCKLKTSPKCLLRHFDDKRGCKACRAVTKDPHVLNPQLITVLKLHALGYTMVEIAAQLKISSHTAKVHFALLRKKIKVENPALVIHYALKHGYIDNHFQK